MNQKIEEKYGLKLFNVIAMIACFALVIFGVIVTIVDMVNQYSATESISAIECLSFLSYLLIIFYMAYGYKVPHGNLLKWIIIIFAAVNLVQTLVNRESYNIWYLLVIHAGLLLAVYMSGRLHKFNKNLIIAYVVTLLFAAAYIIFLVKTEDESFCTLASMASTLIEWISIVIVYSNRYQLHKEAGLTEK